jgi:hypothetical protein
LYLPAVHSQGWEDDAGVYSFINQWTDKFRFWPTCLHIIYSGEVCGRYADDARLIRASVTAPTSMVGFSFPNFPVQ